MELDEEADNMLEVVPVASEGDEGHEESINKRLKTTHQQDDEYERVKAQYESIKQLVDADLRDFIQRALTQNKETLKQIEQRIKHQESQLREKYYYVPHCYAEQIRTRASTARVDETTLHSVLSPRHMSPHPVTPHTTAHVTVRRNVVPRGFEEYSRPRHYAPYFEDGESEADAATIRKYYYAPPPYFNDLATELQLFRLLMALEGQREPDEELISRVNLELASRVSRVPEAIIKYYFAEHTGFLNWQTQRATTHVSVMSPDEFWEWYCRQCGIFMCARHEKNSRWRPVQCARRASDLNAVPASQPCSDTCHFKVHAKEFTGTMPPHTADLVSSGVVVFAKNYCRIRKCNAPAFTCAEVRDYVVTHLSHVKALPKMAAPQTKPWRVNSGKRTHDKELAAYQPCSHEGPCHRSALCHCHAHHLYCEKYCACVATCSNRFKGCKCKSKKPGDGTCDKSCICAQNMRECDFDKCQCDPRTCSQRDLQTKKPKHLWIGASAVAGFGLFAVDRIHSGEFIGEYVGEVIPHNEAERRGLIADKIKRSYLFDTGSDLCVDSTKFGNRLKFANHSSTPNCKPKQLRVNGELRLAFYAVEDIAPSEELFIDYDYADPSSKGITNERPLDVLMNKGHVPLLEMQSRSGDIGLVHERDSDGESNGSETSEEVSVEDEVI